jgi:antirestriction protein
MTDGEQRERVGADDSAVLGELEAIRDDESIARDRPRVYVASLSDYNAGRLHGAWIEADQDADALAQVVRAMLATSLEPGAEEWAIHDNEGFGPLRLSEYESLETISRLGLGLAEHGPAFAAWAAVTASDQETLERFEEAYRGRWDSVEAYAEELLDDVGATEALAQVPEWLQPYLSLDVSGFARDLELGGDVFTTETGDGGVWIFEGNQ